MNLHYRSLLEVSDLMRTKQLSPLELTREMLDRIERLNSGLGAYYVVFADQALAEARAAESEIADGTLEAGQTGLYLRVTIGAEEDALCRLFSRRVD